MAETLNGSCLGFQLHFEVFQAAPSLFNFLHSRLSKNHQQQLDALFSQGCVWLDGKCVTSAHGLKTGQKVKVFLSNHHEEPVDTRWYKLWENEELLAVYKPHLLPVSRTTRNLYITLISLVRRQTPYANAHLLHRLDAETAGVVVIAKNSEANKKWKPRLEQLITSKIYHAWVCGCPDWEETVLECELSEKSGSSIRSQMYVVDNKNADLYPKPKHSKTAFQVLKREGGRSLIECELLTGRKHQIRAHLSYLGHPIVGDKIYSHNGAFYLKRLQQRLELTDYATLGAEFHRLTAVRVELNADDQPVTISIEGRN